MSVPITRRVREEAAIIAELEEAMGLRQKIEAQLGNRTPEETQEYWTWRSRAKSALRYAEKRQRQAKGALKEIRTVTGFDQSKDTLIEIDRVFSQSVEGGERVIRGTLRGGKRVVVRMPLL